jgi:hypothetical protein
MDVAARIINKAHMNLALVAVFFILPAARSRLSKQTVSRGGRGMK